ncbi:MAG: prolipoprotein diacylglyceryl transferase [Sedimentisphaerales bacterium]|nr:prolipoprotein diacylglyceryl transferase [Sedimentisphaerales bacterium]
MWPRIGPIHTYGIFYLTGIVLHFVIGRCLAKRFGLKRRVWIAFGVCYLLGMTVGAKLLFDIRVGQASLPALLSAQHYMQGGLWGGLLAYFALAVPAALLLTRQRLAALDLIALTIPIPWIMAKLGCFFNGCCYGKPTSLPWAVTFPEGARGAPPGVPLHPTQLYEVVLMLVILAVFAALRSNRWRGTKLLWFVALYGVGRTATDFLRGEKDSPALLGPLTITQLICLAAALVAGLMLVAVLKMTGPRMSQKAMVIPES